MFVNAIEEIQQFIAEENNDALLNLMLADQENLNRLLALADEWIEEEDPEQP